MIHNMNALRVIFAISSISACMTEAKQDNYYYGGYRQRPPSPPSWGWSASDVNRQDLDSTTRVAFFGTLATIAVAQCLANAANGMKVSFFFETVQCELINLT